MSNEPETKLEKNNTLEMKKSRLGVIMFTIYSVIYATFIYINVAKNELMKANVGSLNVAIVYSFALITLAFVLAWCYNQYCTKLEQLSVEDHK